LRIGKSKRSANPAVTDERAVEEYKRAYEEEMKYEHLVHGLEEKVAAFNSKVLPYSCGGMTGELIQFPLNRKKNWEASYLLMMMHGISFFRWFKTN